MLMNPLQGFWIPLGVTKWCKSKITVDFDVAYMAFNNNMISNSKNTLDYLKEF
mgnify:FL=1